MPAKREAVVVGPAVERGVLRGLAGRVQVGGQRTLDSGRALGHHRITPLVERQRLVPVVGEVARIRRREHVEVQVQRNVFERVDIQRLHVLPRPDQPEFLCTPEAESHRVVDLR